VSGIKIEFFAPGKPETKGSTKAFMRPGMRHPVITNDNPKAKDWAAVVSDCATRAMGGLPPTRAAVQLSVVFTLARPKGHYSTSGKVRPSAPEDPGVKPDLDKMWRCLGDALEGRVYANDSQVVSCDVSKRYGEKPGAWVMATWMEQP
jgi:Holliday junction resolvase RusA-like endonuclease